MQKLSYTEYLCAAVVKHSLTLEQFITLQRWLDPETSPYQLPLDRNLSQELVASILLHRIEGSSNLRHEVFKAWLVLDIIESVLTAQSQRNLLSWMNHKL